MFLTEHQLQQLTGYSQKAAQVKWLQRNGLRHFVRCDGRPMVPCSAVDGQQQTKSIEQSEPDLSDIRAPRR